MQSKPQHHHNAYNEHYDDEYYTHQGFKCDDLDSLAITGNRQQRRRAAKIIEMRDKLLGEL